VAGALESSLSAAEAEMKVSDAEVSSRQASEEPDAQVTLSPVRVVVSDMDNVKASVDDVDARGLDKLEMVVRREDGGDEVMKAKHKRVTREHSS